jgi:hypothetical protein
MALKLNQHDIDLEHRTNAPMRANHQGEASMRARNALSAFTILSLGLLGACEKTADEQREEAAEERAEQLEEAAEERAEKREELREEANEPRIRSNTPEPGLGTNEPSTNEATAKKGLQAATVRQITSARCAREQKCGNVGAGKDYASAQTCEAKIGEEWADEINAYDCPGGVVEKELGECLTEIKNEDCDSPFDTLGRIVACRSSDICKAVD